MIKLSQNSDSRQVSDGTISFHHSELLDRDWLIQICRSNRGFSVKFSVVFGIVGATELRLEAIIITATQ